MAAACSLNPKSPVLGASPASGGGGGRGCKALVSAPGAGTNKRQLCRVSSLCTQRPGWPLGNSPSGPQGFLGCCHPLCPHWKGKRGASKPRNPDHSRGTSRCPQAPVPACSVLFLPWSASVKALITLPVPHLLLQSPAQRGWRGRRGMWLLPWCPFWGDSRRGTPTAAVGPGCL